MQTAVKMLEGADGRIGGYLIVWGDAAQRDLQGEYFTPETDLGLAWFSRRPVLYQHGLDDGLKAAVIGTLDTLRADAVGVWAEAQLDLRQRYVRVVQQLIEAGVLAWSSGSLPHLVQVAADGRILRWPVVEGSLTPTPAEPRRTDVATLKSAYAALGLAHEFDAVKNPRFPRQDEDERAMTEGQPMNEPLTPHLNDPLTERPARKRLPIASPAEATRSSTVVVGSPYDRLEVLDLLHGYMLLRATKRFQGVSERYANALAHKVQRAGLSAIKADELSYSTQAAFGDEWVPDLWSAQVWQQARSENVLLPLFRQIEMPSNPFELPIEGADPTVYYVPETKNEADLTLGSGNVIPESKIGSGKVQLAARKLALRVGFSAELVEDAVLPVLNLYREQAVRAIADSIDYVLLNGDTTNAATGNINSDNADPADTERYLAFDGLRKLPLVTNIANSLDATAGDATGALTLAKLRTTRFLMPTRSAANPANLAWVVDGSTYAKLLGLAEFLTMDKAGPLATAMTGQIGFVDGIPVLMSAEMPLTDEDGKVTASGSNTNGTALCVYRPGWVVGYRRQIAVGVSYLPYYDSYQMTAMVRLAFARFNNEAASVLFNVTV